MTCHGPYTGWHLRHAWGRWRMIGFVTQRRTCRRCGKAQDR